jgi:hypothetical protein
MVKDFTLEQKTEILSRVIGKEFDWTDGNMYAHGRMLRSEVTGVEYDDLFHFIKLSHRITFEDGMRHDYRTDGSWYFDHYQKDIERMLNVEVYWQVLREGVFPVMLNPDELRKSDSWMIAHDYNGMLVFENYSRAMLCWYEKCDNNSWRN